MLNNQYLAPKYTGAFLLTKICIKYIVQLVLKIERMKRLNVFLENFGGFLSCLHAFFRAVLIFPLVMLVLWVITFSASFATGYLGKSLIEAFSGAETVFSNSIGWLLYFSTAIGLVVFISRFKGGATSKKIDKVLGVY